MENTLSRSFHSQNLSHVKDLAQSSYRVVVPRLFLKVTGDWMLASMLAQLLFWSERTSRKDGFVYKSSRDWQEEVGATDYEVRKFKKLPFIETRIKRANGSPTTHYRILAGVLLDCIHLIQQQDTVLSQNADDDSDASVGSSEQNAASFSTDRLDETDETLTNITTNITTKVTYKGEEPPDINNSSDLADQGSTDDIPEKETKDTDPVQFNQTLAEVTGFDVSIKSASTRLSEASRQLLKAGYTIRDLNDFLPWWKEHDWRWKKNLELPTPEDVLLNIRRSKNYKNRFRGWFGQ